VRLLLDTHALFWWLVEDANLSKAAYAALEAEDSELFVSIASAWEMAIKVGAGKWPEAQPLLDNFEIELAKAEIRLLPISVFHARTAGHIQSTHRDPFDRLLAAQALAEGLTLVTADAKIAGLGATILW
jgi:PIN domain nuclease of toxin-antitoxin system